MTTERLRLLDVNVLVALTNSSHVHHRRAHGWFAGVERWATTPITETGFLRLMLNPVVVGRQHTFAQARAVLASLRDVAGYEWLADDATLTSSTIDLAGLQGHRLVTDLHLVSLAAQHDAVVATFDARLPKALVARDRRHVEVV